MEHFCAGHSRYCGVVDFQASRELGEGDMRLRTTHLLSPIRSEYPRREIGKDFRTVSTSVSEQELEIGGSLITDMTNSLHGQIRLEKLDTVASDSQNVRKLWAVRQHTIFVMMLYTLESRRTFQTDLTLCDLHEFLCLNATDIHEGISEIVSGAISTLAVLLVVTVMSSSGVIVSLSDVPVGQPQPLTTGDLFRY